MSYWKSKVVPKIKKFFDKGKKKGAAEFSKNFDSSKESLDKEIGEKSSDLSPKVVEIYRSSSTFIAKKLLKEPNEATVKENSDATQGVLQELATAGFPGAQGIADAGKKYGPALLPGPVVYLFEKASVFLAEEPLPEEPKAETREVSAEDVKPAEAPATTSETPPPPPVADVPPPAVVEEEKKEAEPIVAAPPPEAAPPAAVEIPTSVDPTPPPPAPPADKPE
uniref:Plasma membrane-associated cation-binding protein 1 n=1 Tax=Davallia tyermanii TaxID=328207 RepID=A0A1C9V3Q9_9MONI|nr:hypothetical protein [Davallia tyermanii]